jgi:folate-dependent phosphoribosylglycinamide formyltransferase PurN
VLCGYEKQGTECLCTRGYILHIVKDVVDKMKLYIHPSMDGIIQGKKPWQKQIKTPPLYTCVNV